MSPLLFICMLDEVIKQRNLATISLKACAFADDVVLIAKNTENLKRNLKIWADRDTSEIV